MDLTALLENPHFVYLAALLRLPLCFADWRKAFLSKELQTLLEQAMPHLTPESDPMVSIPPTSIFPIQAVMKAIVRADSRLAYRSEDITWLAHLLEHFPQSGQMIIGMLFAMASTIPEMVTTVQLAEIRQEPEITWRRRTQEGAIPGSYKAGNRWLLPTSSLLVLGLLDYEQAADRPSPSHYDAVISFVRSRGTTDKQTGRGELGEARGG